MKLVMFDEKNLPLLYVGRVSSIASFSTLNTRFSFIFKISGLAIFHLLYSIFMFSPPVKNRLFFLFFFFLSNTFLLSLHNVAFYLNDLKLAGTTCWSTIPRLFSHILYLGGLKDFVGLLVFTNF